MTEEEKKAYRREYAKLYYAKNKEKIKERNKKKYASNKEKLNEKAKWRYYLKTSEMTEEEKEARRAYMREKYHANKKPSKSKKKLKVEKPDYITVNRTDDGVVTFDAKLNLSEEMKNLVRDGRTNFHLAKKLERQLYINIGDAKRIAVIDATTLQLVTYGEKDIQLVVNELDNFIKNNLVKHQD